MLNFDIFDLSCTRAGDYIKQFSFPWLAVPGIADMVAKLGEGLLKKDFTEIMPSVWVHKNAHIAPTAFIAAPCIIDADTEVRHCAYIRGGVLVGRGCVVGNSTEIKNAILFDGVQVPHFNYVGDSILGYKAHLGAGAIISNLKSDKQKVNIGSGIHRHKTDMRKLGALVGDYVEVGCNSVLNPGTVIGQNSIIYPLSSVRGIVPPNSIYKNRYDIVERKN